jgi:GDPmannose 4,6-dehydratase
MNKIALITGILGQDASYLAEILLEKKYKVIGTRRRTSSPNFDNISSLINHENFEMIIGDITDYSFIDSAIKNYKPDEIYNLAAQSFVKSSFETPFHTFDVDTIGVLNILEVIRKIKPDTKMYQASTSEMFGKSVSFDYDVQGQSARYDGPLVKDYRYENRFGRTFMIAQDSSDGLFQDECTPFMPQSPYGIAKLAAHHLCRLYRDSYGLSTCCGILFNHESPRRGIEFVTRKITDYVGKLYNSIKTLSDGTLYYSDVAFPKLKLGNLDAYRDWGHAKDYARAQYMIMQQDELKDVVICMEETHTVREFCKIAFACIGEDYQKWVEVDPKFYRPSEVEYLRGDCSKAKKILGWKPEYSFQELVEEMVEADIERYR